MTDCVIRSRIDPEIKEKAMEVFEHMGLTLSEAIRIFLYQSAAEKCIPFSINIPNASTTKALRDAANNKNLKKTSISQLRKDWNAACEK